MSFKVRRTDTREYPNIHRALAAAQECSRNDPTGYCSVTSPHGKVVYECRRGTCSAASALGHVEAGGAGGSVNQERDPDMARRVKRRRRQLGEPTRKDFEAIASILCHHNASQGLVSEFASHFARQNPRFAASRFVDATRKCRR